MEPTRFGKYVLLERVHASRTAEVFRARVPEACEPWVLVRRLLPESGLEPGFVEAFIEGARRAAALTHFGIAQVFDLGRVEGAYYLASEYVAGRSLRDLARALARQRRPLPVPVACHLATLACEALDYAHHKRDAQGRPLEIAHGRVAPWNVLCSFEGEARLVGFGFGLTPLGRTPPPSPEQAWGLPPDRRSDTFALGSVLHQALTGPGGPALPPELERVLRKARHPAPAERFQSASELGEALQPFLDPAAPAARRQALAELMRSALPREREAERRFLEQARSARA